MKQVLPMLIFVGAMFALTELSAVTRWATRVTKIVQRAPSLPSNKFTFTFSGSMTQAPPIPTQLNLKTGFSVPAPISTDWALNKIGTFDLQATPCGSKRVVVAVIDTGLDYTNPAFNDSLWVNKGETGLDGHGKDKSHNGVDDDANGYVDDVIGWDFVHDSPLPYDTHGHGTHVSGIITSTASGAGGCGTVEIMTLKYYGNSGAGFDNLANTVRAINYATKNGAQIINYSSGGVDAAPTEKAAIIAADKKGILFVSCAGNNGNNLSSTPYFPASYGLENMLSVASANKENALLPSSNFGSQVSIAAPGLMVMSTLLEGRFGTMSGTSQATAFVSGAAALLLSEKNATTLKVINALRNGYVPVKHNTENKLVGGGLLNLPLALKQLHAN